MWIGFYYLIPALTCTGLVLLLRTFWRNKSVRHWIFVVGLTLSWTPTLITAWHSVGAAQLLLAIYYGDWLSREPPWEFAAAIGITFAIVWTLEKKLQARAKRRNAQDERAKDTST